MWCHRAFAESRKLSFLSSPTSNPRGEVARRYRAYDSHTGTCERVLIVIDGAGVIRWHYRRLGYELRFVFRNFPLTQVHPHAERAAEAAGTLLMAIDASLGRNSS